MTGNARTVHRRIVTGHVGGKAVVLADEQRKSYAFGSLDGLEHAYVWKTESFEECSPSELDAEVVRSAMPAVGGSVFHILTLPPKDAVPTSGEALVAENLKRLPDLANRFEADGMHFTETTDYAIVLDGTPTLELDDGKAVELGRGDTVIQQGTRHGWRNNSSAQAVLAIILLG